MAIGTNDWASEELYPRLNCVRFTEPYLHHGIEHRVIAGIDVPIYAVSVATLPTRAEPGRAEKNKRVAALLRRQ